MVKPACINGHLMSQWSRLHTPVRLRTFWKLLCQATEKLSLHVLFCPPRGALATHGDRSLRSRVRSSISFRSRWITVFSSAPCPNPATSAQILSSYEGQNVTEIEVAGRPQSPASEFEPLFVQKPGEPFSSEKVNGTLAALKASGKAQDVRVEVDAEADGLRVLFIVEPAVYFGIFQFPGAERFNYSRLVQVANFQAQTPFNAADVEKDRQALIKFFQQQGYFQAKVDAEVNVDSANGLANLLFKCQLNRAAKFGALDIVGTDAEETAMLGHSLQTFIASVREC